MKVLVLGASGVIGQHLMISTPQKIEALYYRREQDELFYGLDVTDSDSVSRLLTTELPNCVINLAGENRVDVVESQPERFWNVNVLSAINIAQACASLGTYLIHVSTQGVFSGETPPYGPQSVPDPITEYGRQKREAEVGVLATGATIARLTFVLGVRPFKDIGRRNPLEDMFEQRDQLQVNDRWFSPAFAHDAAQQLWKIVDKRPRGIVHIGEPIRMSRWTVALSTIHDTYRSDPPKIRPVSHNHFPGIAPRPYDTTWAYGSMHSHRYDQNILEAYSQWRKRDES